MSQNLTISGISRETGVPRLVIAALIDEHDIPIQEIGPSKVVTPEGMQRLLPVLGKLARKAEDRRSDPAPSPTR